MAIVKQGTSDWPSNNGEVKSYSNCKTLDLVRGLHMNLMGVDNFSFHEQSSHWKLDIVKEGMSDWKGNDEKITSHSNFKLKFSKKPLDLTADFLFQFGLIWEICFAWVLLWLKIGHCKARNVKLTGQWRRNDVMKWLQTKIFWKVFGSR